MTTNPFETVKPFNTVSFENNLKRMRYFLVFFIVVAFLSAIQHWSVLIAKHGSIASVLLKANIIYSERVAGELEGTIPYIHVTGYAAVLLSGIYSAYKNRNFILFSSRIYFSNTKRYGLSRSCRNIY
jgi:hypothetical protein